MLQNFEFKLKQAALAYRPDFISNYLGYYTAVEDGLIIAPGFLSNDRNYAIIRCDACLLRRPWCGLGV